VNEVRKQLSGIEFSVSWTTRAPRGSEQDGREYHFTSREEFERMLADGLFMDAEVFGNYYGTARSSLEQPAAMATIWCLTLTCRARRRCAPPCPRR